MGTPRIRHCADTGYLSAFLCITATFEQISALLVLTTKIDKLLLFGGSIILLPSRACLVDPFDLTVDRRLPDIVFAGDLADRFPCVVKRGYLLLRLLGKGSTHDGSPYRQWLLLYQFCPVKSNLSKRGIWAFASPSMSL